MLAAYAVPSVFAAAECDLIIALAAQASFDDGRLVGGKRADNVRRARIAWLDEAGSAKWVFDRLLDVVAQANREHFGFDLSEFAERMQVAWYGGETNGYFDWHADVGDGPVAARRKLTLVVQLSAADGYQGGDLETNSAGHAEPAGRDRGSAVLFPAFVLHRVSPVTGGERYSLTVWVHGPAFR